MMTRMNLGAEVDNGCVPGGPKRDRTRAFTNVSGAHLKRYHANRVFRYRASPSRSAFATAPLREWT